MTMTREETLLAGIYDVLKDIRSALNDIRTDKRREAVQSIKESKSRVRSQNMKLLNETTKKTQERILRNG